MRGRSRAAVTLLSALLLARAALAAEPDAAALPVWQMSFGTAAQTTSQVTARQFDKDLESLEISPRVSLAGHSGDVNAFGLLNAMSAGPVGADPFDAPHLADMARSSTRPHVPSSIGIGGMRVAFSVSDMPVEDLLGSAEHLTLDSGLGDLDPFLGTIPRFEAGLSYSARLAGTTWRVGLDGSWQDSPPTCELSWTFCPGNDARSYRLFGQVGWGRAALTGYYFSDRTLEGLAMPSALLPRDTSLATVDSAAGRIIRDGFYLQGTYSFDNWNTRVGIGYRQSSLSPNALESLDSQLSAEPSLGKNMWTVGVYHDVNSWFRFMAEYHHTDQRAAEMPLDSLFDSQVPTSKIRVGGFVFW